MTDSSVTFCTVIVIDTSLTYLLLNAEKCHGETIWKKVFIIISTPHDAIPFVKEIFRTMFSFYLSGSRKVFYTPMTMLSIVLKSGLFSSSTQLGVIVLVHWGVKQLTLGMATVFLKLNALAHHTLDINF